VAVGTVVRFDRRRGYGFVAPEDGGEDVFVHRHVIGKEFAADIAALFAN
jgi:hypothetical protein